MAWFEDWFGTSYYRKLYSNRDEEEAIGFLNKLLEHFDLPPGSRVLDSGCGRGRHAIYLAGKGFDVTGIDISRESIEEAKQSESGNLHFIRHDMRERLPIEPVDLIVNLFTSFGYFEDDHDDVRVITNWCNALKPHGRLVIDYFNAGEVVKTLVGEETIEKEDMQYFINREVQGRFVVKDIRVVDEDGTRHFQEKVKLLTLEHMVDYLNEACFSMVEVFGDYSLSDYNAESSDRMIIVAQKK
ncbi:MAG: methyltransferase domain-containing protein [Bacteroidota bacterium]|nr:methyltransferase domain-containing protein [Bacteroidota bacterium]